MTPSDLKSWQSRLGLSQTEAARLLGMPVQTYRNWLLERSPITHPTMLRMACEWLERVQLAPV